jgi:hypothetical protein
MGGYRGRPKSDAFLSSGTGGVERRRRAASVVGPGSHRAYE